jgi:hypothetical protein
VRKYHVAVLGSKTPMPAWPVPVQSPATALQPVPPYWKTPTSGGPAETLLRKYHVAVAGSNTCAKKQRRSQLLA